MVSALMATLGATTTDVKEAQQVAGLFTLPIAMPFWFSNLLIENPNSPFAIFLSIFPLTAPISLAPSSCFYECSIVANFINDRFINLDRLIFALACRKSFSPWNVALWEKTFV